MDSQKIDSRKETDLSSFDNSWYDPGGGSLKRVIWYFTNVLFFLNPLIPFSSLKRSLLKLFGAKVGAGVVIKPSVNIKYPWKLTIGDHVWIGEKVWIDNLAEVVIEDHVCLSQGAMLLTGNHDYKKSSFDLMIGEIHLEKGSWVGAQSLVGPNVRLHTHAILSAGSVATHDLKAYTIYKGNPCQEIRKRNME
ncbi:MAG: WcaF family extracellular polysaccharide biosynthesis acetyltransferase [Bacteroidota bacterium]